MSVTKWLKGVFKGEMEDPADINFVESDFPDRLTDSKIYDRTWVVIPDGRIGVIDHVKPNGHIAVRPVNQETWKYYPNTSKHWTEEQRNSVPEEICVDPTFTRPAPAACVPKRP